MQLASTESPGNTNPGVTPWILVADDDVSVRLSPAEAEAMVLWLEDLLPDAEGEVVLFAGDDLPVTVLSGEAVAESGVAPSHVTASGSDVTGYSFYYFEGGLTLYASPDLTVTVTPETVPDT